MTKIFSFDAETDGLYGPVWAIGAVVYDGDGRWLNTFSGQLDPAVVTDEWTREHVVPVVDLARYHNRDQLLEYFWRFWRHNGGDDAVAVADCGYPVETGLFRACVTFDPEGRRYQGPFPLHELSTLLWSRGLDPKLDRYQFIDRPDLFAGRPDLVPHNPVADAMVQGLCWVKAAGMMCRSSRAPEPGTGELGSWKPEVVTVVDALRGLDWTGFDPASLDDLADVAAIVVSALNPGPNIGDLLPPPTE